MQYAVTVSTAKDRNAFEKLTGILSLRNWSNRWQSFMTLLRTDDSNFEIAEGAKKRDMALRLAW